LIISAQGEEIAKLTTERDYEAGRSDGVEDVNARLQEQVRKDAYAAGKREGEHQAELDAQKTKHRTVTIVVGIGAALLGGGIVALVK
jgi:hypothetical protein